MVKSAKEQVMERFRPLATIDMRVDYLQQGLGERFIATACISRLGRRIAATNATLNNETGDKIATASAAYMVS